MRYFRLRDLMAFRLLMLVSLPYAMPVIADIIDCRQSEYTMMLRYFRRLLAFSCRDSDYAVF